MDNAEVFSPSGHRKHTSMRGLNKSHNKAPKMTGWGQKHTGKTDSAHPGYHIEKGPHKCFSGMSNSRM